ncbi:cupin [Paracidovorax avenae]|uniref:Cupin 2 domain-containing protein n=1 Tax=Paracidovorax avenae (strain ATCC 19860 / DSM 7227 / CCUG 15838 / JCM 20985 / LMG 2117 / NCPPB 1011) TaxID=643561 RepID=F0Q197_PARA1|nr:MULTISPECIES: cupin [Comamonadaceae]ADX45245.1 cupin 2 domain-containing protein [Paracidovorax avenae ATCC 19860]AVS61386.1 cupin [Paracidovorax avenae]AVS77356.1 cupin [Paracidovorax avenae]AVS80573.1 cupin [Paracidovorax avenae]AVS84326.1 cupin [Paracidovorax avenae]
MALQHARSAEVVSVRPLGAALAGTATSAIIKAAQLEVIRAVLPAGKELRQHEVPGEFTIQCIEGEVELHTASGASLLRAGDLVHLQARAVHSLRGLTDASLLLTLCLVPE